MKNILFIASLLFISWASGFGCKEELCNLKCGSKDAKIIDDNCTCAYKCGDKEGYTVPESLKEACEIEKNMKPWREKKHGH